MRTVSIVGRIMRVFFSAALAVLLVLQPVVSRAQQRAPVGGPIEQQPRDVPATDTAEQRSKLADAGVIALVIAGSIALYEATRGPCACPTDTMRNGRACGGNSAWSRPNGAKPLCAPIDVTPVVIQTWRATKAIPGLF